MAAYARKFAALTAGGQRIVPFGDACNFCAGTRVWRGTCSNNGMKKRDQEGMRTADADSIREQEGGPGSAGQSGDTQGLSNVAEAGPLSVEELVEEGQAFEAEVISGVEDAPDPDVAEVHTREVLEDDVPAEYLEGDRD